MEPITLDLLSCPSCKSELSLNAQNGDEIITEGGLLCLACDRNYPIRKGIVHFIDPQELESLNHYFERYYNRLAPIYSIFSKIALLPFGGERNARMEILKHLDIDGERLLEVSIGNGVNLPYLIEKSKNTKIYGIDISIRQLSQCRRMVDKRTWQVDLFLAMAEALPFRNEMFDNVLHVGGINFFSRKKQAIDEMIRVVRPGGKIVIADEVERLAKRFSPSRFTSLSSKQEGTFETTIYNLIPSSMQDICMENIWKAHGKYHGYCLEFTKPKSLS